MNLVKNCLQWLFAEDRRHAERHKLLPVVAYYWDGAEPIAHGVLDVSMSGLYLLTKQRWYPDTVLAMTLQRVRAEATDPHRAIAVNAMVIRSSVDGVGFAFIFPEKDSPKMRSLPTATAGARDIQAFLKYVQADKRLPQ